MRIKNIEQHILTKYPLIWNTRAYWVIPLSIVLHVVFFAAGYFSFMNISQLHSHGWSSEGEVIFFSVLLSFVLISVWFVFYFRNNAFKSFYPIRKLHLFYEFLILLVGIGLGSTFFLSFEYGRHCHISRLTSEEQLLKDAEVVNLASHFIPATLYDFDSRYSCENYPDTTPDIAKNDPYESTEIAAMPAGVPAKADSVLGLDTVVIKEGVVIDEGEKKVHFSYMHYCKLRINLFIDVPQKTRFGVHRIAKRWLLNKQKDSIEKVLTDFLNICDKYHIDYRFDPKKRVQMVFAEPDFSLNEQIGSTSFDSSNENAEYIEVYKLETALSRAAHAKRDFWNRDILIPLLYYAFSFAIVIFSFRITRLRIWFLSLLGSVLWGIILSLIGISSNMEEGMMLLFVILALGFVIFSFMAIREKGNKLFSGLTLVWFTWMLPSIIPLIFGFIYSSTRLPCQYVGNTYNCPTHPMHAWIDQNWLLINSMNFIFILLVVVFVLLPLARKWQANPEE